MIGVRVGMVAAEGREDLSSGPKLEDFLGGVGEPLGRFSGDSATAQPEAGGGGIYDSDLKSIAAGFLRCPADQLEPESKTKAAGAAEAVPEQKKAVDTFGQRTSIYRGVTR